MHSVLIKKVYIFQESPYINTNIEGFHCIMNTTLLPTLALKEEETCLRAGSRERETHKLGGQLSSPNRSKMESSA